MEGVVRGEERGRREGEKRRGEERGGRSRGWRGRGKRRVEIGRASCRERV